MTELESLGLIRACDLPDPEDVQDGDTFGCWTYQKSNETLQFYRQEEGRRYEYEIDLDRVNSAAEAMGWLFHLSHKTWITAEDMGHLFMALRETVGLDQMVYLAPKPAAARKGCPERAAMTKELRFEILKRDGFRCVYCGSAGLETKLVVDHVVPVKFGGRSTPDNLVSACEPCNQGKRTSLVSHPRP